MGRRSRASSVEARRLRRIGSSSTADGRDGEVGVHEALREAIVRDAAFRHRYPDGQEVEGFAVVFDCETTGGTLHNGDGEVTRQQYVAVDAMPSLMMPYPRALFEAHRRLAVFE